MDILSYAMAKNYTDSSTSKKIKTSLDSTLVAETRYYLGPQTNVSFALPTSAEAGEEIWVVFYNGTTAATISISGNYIGAIPTSFADHRVELKFLYDGLNWVLSSNKTLWDRWLCFTAEQANSTVSMEEYGEPASIVALETSTDGLTWSPFTIGTTVITLANVGDKVYFRGNNTAFSSDDEAYRSFVMTGKIAASGNVMSILDKNCYSVSITTDYALNYLFSECTALTTAPILPATTLSYECYNCMFAGCTSLATAPELPATTLGEWCYYAMFDGCTALTTIPAFPAATLADGCCSHMFDGCTALTTAPELPATALASYCYSFMFNGCTSLATAPELPATALASQCYYYMFNGCTSLTTAPELPTTAVASYCYSSMFSGCTSLATAPELPATTLEEQCYSSMFSGCTSLATAPELPATTLEEQCYSSMFSGCTALTASSELPATTLMSQCYRDMFNGCTSLTRMPSILATTLAYECCYRMFQNCTALVTATALFAANAATECYRSMFEGCVALVTPPILLLTQLATSCCYSMFNGCTSLIAIPDLLCETSLVSSCYAYMFKNCTNIKISESQTAEYQYPIMIKRQMSTSGWNTGMFQGTGGTFTSDPAYNTTYYTTHPNYLCFTSAENNSTISIQQYNNPTGISLEMSTDAVNWTTYEVRHTITMPAGTTIYFRGDNTTISKSDAKYYNFWMQGKIYGSGNIMSLLDKNCISTTLSSDYCFTHLFDQCRALITAPRLPATTLSTNCYAWMFASCTQLSKMPSLPATTLEFACYKNMFYGCTSLITLTSLSATTLAEKCYSGMFEGCTALTTISKLPATALRRECYAYMFAECTNIKVYDSASPGTFIWRVPYSGTGTSSSGDWNYEMLYNTGGTFTNDPSINTNYYVTTAPV